MKKIVFIDAEYTGEHARTTLVSIGLVDIQGESLEVTFNDYEVDQVTDWLSQNVLSKIDFHTRVSRSEGFQKIKAWLDAHSMGDPVSLVSWGKTHDVTLLFELWHLDYPERKYFHNLYCLPHYLNHAAHFDFPTIAFCAGLNPNSSRDEILGRTTSGRHSALDDARRLRECFLKVFSKENFPYASII